MLLTVVCLLVDLFSSVCTSVFVRVSLSNRRRKSGKGPVSPVTGTKQPGHTCSLSRRKCPGYVVIMQDLGFLRIQKKTAHRSLQFLRRPLHAGCNRHCGIVVKTQQCTQTRRSSINHIHVVIQQLPSFSPTLYVSLTGLDC